MAILAASIGGGPGASAQPPRFLSDAESQLAHQIEEANLQQLRAGPSPLFNKGLPQLARTPAGRTRRSTVTSVTLLGSPGTSAATDRQALVTRYEYATGLTLTTVVDLNAGRVVEVRAEANRPTPLADDEIQRAIVLASRAVPDLATTPRAGLKILALVDSKTTSRRYGHRLVAVWRETPPPSPRVLVDLSTEQVVNANF
ncbi:MAG TPA: hypothetical protein VK548_13360 [Candidatus Acidoferrum sp.]|nr:hypothetical protein [Candidatus Acidoferrum sp.]